MESLVDKAIRCITMQLANGQGSTISLDALPAEMAERVLCQLQAAHALNNSTLQAVAGSQLTTLDLYNTFHDTNLSAGAIGVALRRCTNLEALVLSYRDLSRSNIIDLICSEPLRTTLRVLHLAGCKLSAYDARRIIRYCVRLEDVDFAANAAITDQVLLPLAHDSNSTDADADDACCKSHFEIPADVFDQIAEGDSCRKRKRSRADSQQLTSELSDATTATITTESIPDAPFESVFMVPVPDGSSTKKPKRRELDITDTVTRLAYSSPSLSVAAAPSSIPVATNIRYHLSTLRVSGCTRLTNQAIASIAHLCPLLQEFDCAHCPSVDDIGPIVKFCRFLKSLNISDCPITTSTVRWPALTAGSVDGETAVSLRHLHTLEFSGSSVVDEGLSDWLRACSHSLRVLELRNKVFVDANCISPFLENATALESLDLYGCALPPSVLAAALENNKRLQQSLRHVNICGFSTSLVLENVQTARFPALRSLFIDGCQPSSIPQLRAVLLRSPLLARLSLQSVTATPLRQAQCASLLAGLTSLTELEIMCMASVSMTFVGLLARLLPSLRSLTLCAIGGDTNTNRACLTVHELEAVRANFPALSLQVWRQNVTGNRCHQTLIGRASSKTSAHQSTSISAPETPRITTNKLNVHSFLDAGSQQLRTTVAVDDIPLWCLEHQVSLDHLVQTTSDDNQGALPLVKCWCCNCNINDFNGVSFSSDVDFVYWTVREPGPFARYRFAKSQYHAAVEQAVRLHAELVLQQQELEQSSSLLLPVTEEEDDDDDDEAYAYDDASADCAEDPMDIVVSSC